MVSYLCRLESLINKWQFKRQTLEISQRSRARSEVTGKQDERVEGVSGIKLGSSMKSKAAMRRHTMSVTITEVDRRETNVEDQSIEEQRNPIQCSDLDLTSRSRMSDESIHFALERPGGTMRGRDHHSHRLIISNPTALTLYTCTFLVALVGLMSCSSPSIKTVNKLTTGSGESTVTLESRMGDRKMINPRPHTKSDIHSASYSELLNSGVPLGDRTIFTSLMEPLNLFAAQLASSRPRDRWANTVSENSNFQGIRYNNRRRQQLQQTNNYLTRVLNNLRNRFGNRNSIRVHNAFRDFAWRILSSLSMPTPVIYELRRQNFYPPEEDMLNDSLFNRNTSKTIRSKRHLVSPSLLHGSSAAADWFRQRLQRTKRSMNRFGRDDDDEFDADSFRDRLQDRLDRLVRLSRRSLFGRVVRLPALFPFRRQEGNKLDVTATTYGRSRRKDGRRAKESDKQRIFINGKQYFVDDDGKLKEAKGRTED